MSKLVELQKLYETVREEEQNYWIELRQSLENVFNSVSQMLGVDPNNAESFRVGVVNSEGKFMDATLRQLPKNDRSCEFALQLMLSQESSLIPPNFITTEWSARETSEGLELKGKGERLWSFEFPDDAAKYIIGVFEKKISSFSPYAL